VNHGLTLVFISRYGYGELEVDQSDLETAIRETVSNLGSQSMKFEQLALSIGIGILLLAIFTVDARMALGFTPWLLYVIPIGLTYWLTTHYAPLVVAGLCMLLMVADYGLSPQLVPHELALTNRIIGTVTFWGLAWLIMSYQILLRRQSAITEQTKLELMERTQDLGRLVTALQSTGNQDSDGAEHAPVVVQGFRRHVANVLVAEGRRLEEKVAHLTEKDEGTRPADKSLHATLDDLQELRKQLEQLQRDLLV
jgi:hypothetical protein